MTKRMTTTLAKSAGAETATEGAEKGESEVEITELAKLEPTRMDGVGDPATGFPILMMKSIAAPVAKASQAAATTGCGCCENCACGDSAKAAKTTKKAKKAERVAGGAAKDHTGTGGKSSNASSKAAENITPDVIKQAVAEARAADEERITALEAQLAKVLATPIPGGPLLVTPQTQRPAENSAAQKAARLRAIAAQTSDPEVKRDYEALAAREEGAPIT